MNSLNIMSSQLMTHNPLYSTPNTISGLVNWYESDYGVTYDSGNNEILTWLDKSGYGNTLYANVANNPVYVSSGINNYPSVQFKANSWYGMLTANSTNSSSATFISVMKYNGNVQTSTAGIWCTQQPLNAYSTNIALYGQVSMQVVGLTNLFRAAALGASFTYVSGTATTLTANQTFVGTISLSFHANNYANMRSWVNSGPVYEGTSTSNTVVTQYIYNPLSVGSWAYNIGTDGPAPRTWNGLISAIAIYNRTLSDDERQTVINYFSNKYNL